MSKVEYTVEDEIAYIRLNRPEKLNAMDMACWELVGIHAQAATADQSVRAVIVTSTSPKAFSAGLDFTDPTLFGIYAGTAELSPARRVYDWYHLIEKMKTSLNALANCPKPTVCVISGHCYGVGMQLALCADIRIAGSSARIGMLEVIKGIVPDMGGTQRLPRLVGSGRAKDLVLTGRKVDATEALAVGLVEFVHPDDALAAKSLEYVRSITANAPLAVEATKRAIDLSFDVSLDVGLKIESELAAMVVISEDSMAGLGAFKQALPKFNKG